MVLVCLLRYGGPCRIQVGLECIGFGGSGFL